MSAFVLQFAYCIANSPLVHCTVPSDKRAEVEAQEERSEETQIK